MSLITRQQNEKNADQMAKGYYCQVGRSGVDRASSSDARGPGFKPRPLHLKNTTSLPETKWLFGARCVASFPELGVTPGSD